MIEATRSKWLPPARTSASATVVVGAQWGDEGKGKIVDCLACEADLVVRFQGGDNAGHTVENEHGLFHLHLIPSGIFNPRADCLLGAGTVVNVDALLNELGQLHEHGLSVDRLYISGRAHLVMPYHRVLDGLEEGMRGRMRAGTTMRGIGPAYTDKARRIGIRAGDLLRPVEQLRERVEIAVVQANRLIKSLDPTAQAVDAEGILQMCRSWRDAVGARVIDDFEFVQDHLARGSRILLEGQLGVMRDLEWGIYPHVTSSSPTAGSASVGAGIPPQEIGQVIGVVKAYSTSVGDGPFVTELTNSHGDQLREAGAEFGTTTGRPRRCGWFDAVAVRYAARLNGFTSIAVMKLDVLSRLETLRVCTAYSDGDRTYRWPPTALLDLAELEPVYEDLPGWSEDLTQCHSVDELPDAAVAYLRRLAESTGVPLRMVSVGPSRDATFEVDIRP